VDPCAKKLATCTNKVKHDPSAENPTSEYAAIGAERENPPMKDLTRGTEDVDDRIVRCEDPHTSTEAPAKGTSAKCTEMTPVVLESTPHETQNEPQDSPQVTLRLPIEGEPSECKREVAESVMTAGRMKGKAKMANPLETIADIDRGTPLGG